LTKNLLSEKHIIHHKKDLNLQEQLQKDFTHRTNEKQK
jgi:hypothetical protein